MGAFRKYNADLRAYGGVQHFHFDTSLECFKYSVIFTGHKPLKKEVSKTNFDLWQ